MTVTRSGKNFFSVELAQNESYDRNHYSDEMGLGLACVIYFEGTAGLEFSADETTWIAEGTAAQTLFSNQKLYPQFVRPTGTGTTTIHFYLKR